MNNFSVVQRIIQKPWFD